MTSTINNVINWLDENDEKQLQRIVEAVPVSTTPPPPQPILTQYIGVGQEFESALVERVDDLETRINTETVLRAAADDQIALQLTTFETQIANLGAASVQSLFSSVADLGAQYTIKTDVNGFISGFGLASELPDGAANNNLLLSPSSTFTVMADRFRVIKTFQSNTFIITGLVSVPAACTVVTGSGTNFTSQIVPNDKIVIGGEPYRVTNVSNATSLTIHTSFKAASVTNVPVSGIRDDLNVINTNTTNVFTIDTTTSPSSLIFNGKLYANDIITGTLNANTSISVVNPANVEIVRMGKLSSNNYGFEIRDANNKVIITTDGFISSNVFILGSNSTLGELAFNASTPSTNFIGSFSTTPDPYSYPLNSIYKDTDDETSYINVEVEATPGVFVRQWELFIPSATSGFTTTLTKEAVVLPALSNGFVSSYTSANTEIYIYKGNSDDTSNWVITKTDGAGVSSTLTSNRVQVTNSDNPIGSVTISAANGSTTFTKVFTVSKAIAGTNGISGSNGAAGLNARTVTLTTPTQAFAYNAAGNTPSPTATVVTATTYNTEGTVYYEFIVGSNTVQNTTVSNYTYTPPNLFTSMPQQVTVRVREGSTLGSVVALDTISMIGVKPGDTGPAGNTGPKGVDAVSGLLTNESVAIAANSTGGVSSFTAAGGTFLVFDGVVSKTGNAAVTYSVVNTSGGLSITIGANGVYAVSSLTSDVGTATLRAVYSGVTVDKIYTITKSRAGTAGANGVNGVSPRVVSLTLPNQAFSYNANGANPTPTTSTITATAFNTSGTRYYEFLLNDTTVQNSILPTYLYEAPASYDSMPQQVIVRLREGANNTTVLATDIISLIGIKPGSDGANGVSGSNTINGFLTNESATVSANSLGGVASFAAGSGTFVIYDGLTEKTGDPAVTYTVVSNTGVSITISNTGSYSVSAMSADTGVATLRASYNGLNINKIYNIAKSLAGANGANGANGVNGVDGVNGLDAAVITLSRDSILLPAESSGFVTSYANASANVVIFKGASNDTANWSLSKIDSVGVTSVLSNNVLTITNVSSAIDTGTITITATRNGYATQVKGISISKAKQGPAGANGANGTSGVRGSITVYVSGRTSWSDAIATQAVSSSGGPILNDIVTQYGPGFSQTRFWNGVAWVTITAAIDGNLLVTGTVGADKLSVTSISAITSDIGVMTAGVLKSADNKFIIDLSNRFIRILT